ncbi:MAG: hypothetical protein NTU95_05475 [Methanothrix sp.]|nr:hypothetical protein [Methanothrix sp.]
MPVQSEKAFKILSDSRFHNPRARARPPSPASSSMPGASTPRPWAQMEACLPKDAVDNNITEREQSDVVHDQASLSGGKNAGDEQAEASQEIKGFLGWLESYLGGKGGRPHAQDPSAELLRARL